MIFQREESFGEINKSVSGKSLCCKLLGKKFLHLQKHRDIIVEENGGSAPMMLFAKQKDRRRAFLKIMAFAQALSVPWKDKRSEENKWKDRTTESIIRLTSCM